jgi:hypothetical protein
MYISCRDKNILLVWYIEISFYTVERSQIARAAIAARKIFPVLVLNNSEKWEDTVSRYFEFYRVNLNGENKTLNGSLVPIYNAACMPLFYWLLNIRRN